MGKHCEGLEEPDPDSNSIMDVMSPIKKEKTHAPLPGDKQDALLQAIWALCSQVEALQLEQQTLCHTVNEPQTTKPNTGGGASTHKPSARADNKNDSLQKEQQPQMAQPVALAIQFQVPYFKQ